MIKVQPFSFSLMTGQVSSVHRMWLADTLSPALQTSVPKAKQLQPGVEALPRTPQFTMAETLCGLGPERLWLSRESSAPCLLTEPRKAALPTAFQGVTAPATRSAISPFFDHRKQLPFASEPNLASFSWLKWQQAEGPLLGTNPGRLVTLKTYPFN